MSKAFVIGPIDCSRFRRASYGYLQGMASTITADINAGYSPMNASFEFGVLRIKI